MPIWGYYLLALIIIQEQVARDSSICVYLLHLLKLLEEWWSSFNITLQGIHSKIIFGWHSALPRDLQNRGTSANPSWLNHMTRIEAEVCLTGRNKDSGSSYSPARMFWKNMTSTKPMWWIEISFTLRILNPLQAQRSILGICVFLICIKWPSVFLRFRDAKSKIIEIIKEKCCALQAG